MMQCDMDCEQHTEQTSQSEPWRISHVFNRLCGLKPSFGFLQTHIDIGKEH